MEAVSALKTAGGLEIDDSTEAYAARLSLSLCRLSEACEAPYAEAVGFFPFAYRYLTELSLGGGKKELPGLAEDKNTAPLLSFAASELEGLLPYGEGGRTKDLCIISETLVQLLLCMEDAYIEKRPFPETGVRDILYAYVYDYSEEFIEDYVVLKSSGKKAPRRFVTELLFGEPADGRCMAALELFFGDRLRARLEDSLKNVRGRHPGSLSGVKPSEYDAAGAAKLKEHGRRGLSELIKKTGIIFAVMLMCFLSACAKGREQESTGAREETADVRYEEYAATVAARSPDGSVMDIFGVMHATVLDVQKGEKDGLYVYILRDKSDPENAWTLSSQYVGSIVADVEKGKNVSVLFSGNIVEDPDSVEFIAILDEHDYKIKSAEGTTVTNMMSSFTIRERSGKNLTFIKDNCKVDRDALSTERGETITVYYADCGLSELYPVRVYKEGAAARDRE